MKKRIFNLILLLITCLPFCATNMFSFAQDMVISPKIKTVLISQVIDHPALNESVRGIVEELEASGYKNGVNLVLKIESAQGSASLAQQIAVKFVNQSPDVVVGVGTLSAQSFVKDAIAGRVKAVFTSVTDPLMANLVQSLDKPGNNTSGVSDFIGVAPQLELFKKLQPNLKTIGIIYNPGELNSIKLIKDLEIECPKLGLSLIKQAATKTAEVGSSATKLAKQADAIFIYNDNTALAAFRSIVKAANLAKIPVYVSDIEIVDLGAVAALGPNQYDIGKQTGKIIVRILNGEDINKQPVVFPSRTEIYLNLDAASRANITIPQELLKSATKVLKINK